ncbi:MAG TPA: hypothetical protein VFS67_06500 [Polyangiaceae bacterium]|jgi:hypothetical protein|nr:hypothetical protein [Polyangiaceae bacterium]
MLGEPMGLELPPAKAIVAAAGVTRSRAYEAAAQVVDFSSRLEPRVGRPPAQTEPPPRPRDHEAVSRAVLGFVMTHPGCVHGHGKRQRYGDGFRRFLVELRAEHAALSIEDFAASAAVPPGTLRSWLMATSSETAADPPAADPDAAAIAASSSPSLTTAHIDSVLGAYGGWCGGFRDFCEYVQRELCISWGRDTIAQVLELHGVRRPQRRGGRSPDELALRSSFQTFFAGAQWVGDGMSVPVTIGSELLKLNFELQCDAFSGAFVGISIRDAEDSAAVIESFRDGIATTGAAPLAELLDNKPSNHTPEVDTALGDTIRIRATVQRPQNKAHVEGAFGLFSTTAPPLELDHRASARQIAAQVLGLVTTTWARAMNHRPRPGRGGSSRAQLYALEPTDEQIAAARRTLEERRRRQELARQTLEARQRPDVRAFLDAAFDRLELTDPERHVRLAISRYPLDPIIAGVAIFESKQRTASLPDGVDARYLLGIVRNVHEQREGELVAEALLRLRRQARDIALERLSRDQVELRATHRPTRDILAVLVDRALLCERALDRTFWLDALASFISDAASDERDARYRAAARCIHATFRAEPRRREHAVRVLAERLVPLA